jgi:predicted amidohydrolase
MWENCFYVGGDDPGIIDATGTPVGAAMCWELMRTATAERLRSKVELVVAGSAWWSVPQWRPSGAFARFEAANARTATSVASAMARSVGAPVVHAAHCGPVQCRMPLLPGFTYRGHYEGGACVVDGRGGVLAFRDAAKGPGCAIAEIEPGSTAPTLEIGRGFWMHPRGAIAAVSWAYQGAHGRWWYRRNALGRPAERRTLGELAPTGEL